MRDGSVQRLDECVHAILVGGASHADQECEWTRVREPHFAEREIECGVELAAIAIGWPREAREREDCGIWAHNIGEDWVDGREKFLFHCVVHHEGCAQRFLFRDLQESVAEREIRRIHRCKR